MPILDRNLALIFRDFGILSNTLCHAYVCTRPGTLATIFQTTHSIQSCSLSSFFISRTVQSTLFISLERAYRHGAVVSKSYFHHMYFVVALIVRVLTNIYSSLSLLLLIILTRTGNVYHAHTTIRLFRLHNSSIEHYGDPFAQIYLIQIFP